MTEVSRANTKAPLWYFALTILMQVTALATAYLVSGLYPSRLTESQSLLLTVIVQTAVVFALIRLIILPVPWRIANLLLPVGLMVTLTFGVTNEILLAIVLFLGLIYLPTFWTRVPYYPTSRPMYDVILEALPADRPFIFIDLGCGFGPLLEYLARHRPLGHFEGVEIGPLPYLGSKLRFLLWPRQRMRIRFKSFWSFSFAPYDFVYAFLAPGPMPQLWQKVKAEMRPDTTFFTNTFAVSDTSDHAVTVSDKHSCTLYMHRIK